MIEQRDWIRIDLRHEAAQAAQIADYTLALNLLAGFAKSKTGRAITRYPKKCSAAEQAGRQALAREVRRDMRGLVGELLALALDPETESTYPAPTRTGRLRATRRVKFENPSRQKSTVLRDMLVADCMRRALSQSASVVRGRVVVQRESALAAAKRQFGISRTRAQQIWKAHEVMITRGLDATE